MGWILKQKRKLVEGDITRDRFRIDVSENIGTSGMGTTTFAKWKFQVVDTTNGRPLKTDYQLTAGLAYAQGERWLDKFLKQG